LDSPSSGASKEKPATEDSASPAAAAFLKKAAEDGRMEVDLARLAVSKTSNAAVKNYAEMLITDHEKAGDDVASMAEKKSVTLSKERPGAPNATKTRLEKLSGAAFDRAYAAAMVDDHKKAVAEFEKAMNLNDRDVKSFAQETLPTLKHHLEEAQKLAK
jgi:putative membrane protein